MATITRVPVRPLARANERPAERLGRRVAAILGRERVVRRRVFLAEDVHQPAPRLGAGPGPFARGAAVGRERGKLLDRLAEREVADLRPAGIGPDDDDAVARGGAEEEEVAQEPRLAHSRPRR